MKKGAALLLVLVLAVVLAGCTAQNDGGSFSESYGTLQKDPLTPATDVPWPDEDTYWGDPSAEEDIGTAYVPGAVYDDYGNTLYAGATPIPLDPVDMPTPTPRPELTFGYTEIVLDSMGIKFEAPQGWMMDNTTPGTVVLMDPQSYDNYNANMTVTISSVPATYRLADVKEELRNYLETMGKGFSTWKTYESAARTLMGKDGYYNNYRGEMADGTVVRGRVMVALLDGNRIMIVHMAAPGWFNESYMGVVAHFRDTLKAL